VKKSRYGPGALTRYGVNVVGKYYPLQGVIMSGSASETNIFPKQKKEYIGVWIVGPPGCGKTTICRAVCDALSDLRLHVVDSDDTSFKWAQTKTPAELANVISHFCHDLSVRPILVCSVDGPSDHDRWIVFGINRSIIECMKERPEAYDFWISGKYKGQRAIDTWQASGTVHHVLNGNQEEMTQQVVNRIRQVWACSI